MKSDEKRAAARKEREEVLARIAALEAAGGESFFVDVEPDPPGHPLAPDEVDYLRKKPANRVKAFFARRLADLSLLWFGHDLRITLEGVENLRGLPHSGGAIMASNHFSKFESLCVLKAAKKVPGRHRLWRVIKGNNVFIPGIIGFLMRHCDTLPLSTNLRTQRLFAEDLGTILSHGGLVLIYPEQAMWWNYRKPPAQARGILLRGKESCARHSAVCHDDRSDGAHGRRGLSQAGVHGSHSAPDLPRPRALSARKRARHAGEKRTALPRGLRTGLPLKARRETKRKVQNRTFLFVSVGRIKIRSAGHPNRRR